MKYLFLLVFILSSCVGTKPTLSTSSPIYGQDFLGIQNSNFKVKDAIFYNPHVKVAGHIANTFGTSLDKVERLIKSTSPLFYRVHIWNTTCNTNKVCYPYELTYGFTNDSLTRAVENRNERLLKRYKEEVVKYRELSKKYPSTTFLVSPAVEHHLSKKAWRVLSNETKSVWPEVTVVNSPGAGTRAEIIRGEYIEKHGNKDINAADIVSLDGTDATDIDINEFITKASGARLVLFWTRGYNCRNQGPFEDPRKRKSCPSSSTFDLMAHIKDERGIPPVFSGTTCKIVTPFKAPQIYKPLAEDLGNGDTRSNKPVAITSLIGNKISVLDFKGKIIGSLGYYGPYKGSLSRYYSSYRGGTGEGGYGFEKLAKNSSGSPYTFLQDKRTCTGPIITGKRAGLMR